MQVGTQPVRVTVPDGLYAGAMMPVEWGGARYNIAVPDGFGPGMQMTVELPAHGAPQYQPPPGQQQQGEHHRLDFDMYRQFAAGEGVPEEELQHRFDALDSYAQSYNFAHVDGGRGQDPNAPAYTGGAYNYAPQRAARLAREREKARELMNRRDLKLSGFLAPTPLQEFLRFQEWYVQYCKLRNIGQHQY